MGPELAVGAVVLSSAADPTERSGHVLLIQRARPPSVGRWTLPGGRVQRGESLEAALRREVMEETSIAITVGALVEVIEIVDAQFHYVIMDYWAVPVGDPHPPRAGDDAADARWVALSDLAKYETTQAVQRVIARACELAKR